MNLILKIVQGPNAGAEVALIEGVNVKLGKSDDCDIVLNDQTLPDVVCEIEVGSERVMLLLPGGAQERMEPYRVKVFETTAIAIGPADEPWGPLVWPDPEEEKKEEEPQEPEEVAPPPSKFKKLQIALLVVLVLVVLLELLLWLFWPTVNDCMARVRKWWQVKYEDWTTDELEKAARPIHVRNLAEIAEVYKVSATIPSQHSERKATLEGNVRTRAERLRLTAEAYSVQPNLTVKLTDDETMRQAVHEVLEMIVPGKLKIVEAADRKLVLSGRVKDVSLLKRVLAALKQDVPYLTNVDCSKVEVNPDEELPAEETDVNVRPVVKNTGDSSSSSASSSADASSSSDTSPVAKDAENADMNGVKPRKLEAKLPVVGVMTTPYPCIVLRNGERIVEGGEFVGYIVDKIGADVILLRKGKTTFEWRP